ncbi:transposase IS4 family protein [Thiorhodococcus drewsii AZ1]|uniref:Transposase IS4 family protein n=2 Tax=Thiorhodococcus drewsii TaxID=210408 RepID=G2E8G3_9GAMM|nr:transposase IS4 family protein [Thiorhodococcus drewsii AZ1]
MAKLHTQVDEARDHGEEVTVQWYGNPKRLRVLSAVCLWHRSGWPPLPIRWVLVADPKGKLPTQAFLSTDLTMTPARIVELFVWRWSLEVTCEETPRHLAVETPCQWSDLAIARTTPVLLALFSLACLMVYQWRERWDTLARSTAWYFKPQATFSDCLALVRRTLWAEDNYSDSTSEPDQGDRIKILPNTVGLNSRIAPDSRARFLLPLRESTMPEMPSDRSLLTHFSTLEDPRCAIKQRHRLNDMIAIAITGVLCGADGWVQIAEFGRAKQAWLERFLELPNGIPAHDTFGRVFSLIDPQVFETCFRDWVATLREILPGEVIAIDGKTLRRSHDRGKGLGALHLVSAWAADNRLVLGQIATEAKSNEITAIPKLLDLLLIQGCIVTIDAMGCQTKIAAQIIDQGADYVLALKGNQSTLATEVEEAFIDADAREYVGLDSQFLETVEQGHGRRETRRYRTLGDLSGVSRSAGWTALNMIGMVESEREIHGVTSRETRYYIANTGNDVSVFARAVRAHWGVENELHWSLDVAFNEDASRVRDPDARENLAVMRRVALTRLKHDDTKLGIQSKRLKAAWNEAYLEKLLFEAPKSTAQSSTSKSSNIRKT